MSLEMIPYGRQSISEEDIQAVVDVLRSEYLTQGPAVPKFEQAVSSYTGARYAVAVNSGTSALHLACHACGLGIGDWLWTSPITFVASANCGLYCGAQVDFVDIDSVTWNISIDRFHDKLQKAKKENRLPKVVVVVHLCGLPCDMKEINVLAQEYGFYVVEDACHAIGGRYCEKPIGNCRYSDITIFSFHPVKTITCGEGGMAVTNDPHLAEKMEMMRSHGITRNPELMTHTPDGPWYYQQMCLGFNYRMADLQAALGRNQLKRLDQFVARRHELADRYEELLSELPLQLPHRSEKKYSGMHLYVVRVMKGKTYKEHKEIFETLRQRGIGVNLHYIPVYSQPYYQKMGFRKDDFPEAERYYSEAISIPLFTDLSEMDQDKVVNALMECLQ